MLRYAPWTKLKVRFGTADTLIAGSSGLSSKCVRDLKAQSEQIEEQLSWTEQEIRQRVEQEPLSPPSKRRLNLDLQEHPAKHSRGSCHAVGAEVQIILVGGPLSLVGSAPCASSLRTHGASQ